MAGPGPCLGRCRPGNRRRIILHETTTTRATYDSLIRNHIRPALGAVPLTKLHRSAAEILERFYGELRRCSQRCDGRPRVDHRVAGPHDGADRQRTSPVPPAGCLEHSADPRRHQRRPERRRALGLAALQPRGDRPDPGQAPPAAAAAIPGRSRTSASSTSSASTPTSTRCGTTPLPNCSSPASTSAVAGRLGPRRRHTTLRHYAAWVAAADQQAAAVISSRLPRPAQR
jgi:hypothetical protein